MMRVSLQFRLAALLLWLSGAGFGLPCIQAIANLLTGRDIPYVMGFPAYGRGPFERYGLPTTVPLLVGFLVVCLLECLAGRLVWRGMRRGAILALLLLPAGAVYWWGFALPFGPIFALVRTLLIVQRWNSLT
ncbi:MAG TPA: hypothetical protein PKK15_20865 [Kouleothrix sp.]|nr:hypothetical protein [Kouleothrix sp.]